MRVKILRYNSEFDAGQNPTTYNSIWCGSKSIILFELAQNPTTIIQFDAGQNPATIIQFDVE